MDKFNFTDFSHFHDIIFLILVHSAIYFTLGKKVRKVKITALTILDKHFHTDQFLLLLEYFWCSIFGCA